MEENMSTFEVNITRVRNVFDHPNADRLSIVKIGDYSTISAKLEDGSNRYAIDDFVVYVPEGAVVPDYLLKKYNFWNDEKNIGMLSGSKGNRVKAIKLRGVLSQGLMFPVYNDGQMYRISGETRDLTIALSTSNIEGMNVAELLGITKYEPPIPVAMAGQVCNIYGKTLGYDIENLKKHIDVLSPGTPVVVTEKLHGTCCQIGYIPGLNHNDLPGDWYVGSKGLSAQGLVFKNNEANAGNLYLKTVTKLGINKKVIDTATNFYPENNVYVLGEIYGVGVQDLTYGQSEPTFAAFDVYIRKDGNGRYLNVDEKKHFLKEADIPMVNILFEGPYDRQIVAELRDGKTTIEGGTNIREGVVVTPLIEMRDDKIGRVILKDVSDDYLTRKNATEFN